MTHVRTSPYYPQSNGKIERWTKTLKVTTIRPNAPSSLEEARQMVAAFVAYYNHDRLHSAIGFVTPADLLTGRADTIWAARDQKLEAARAAGAPAGKTCRQNRTTNSRQCTKQSPGSHISAEPVRFRYQVSFDGGETWRTERQWVVCQYDMYACPHSL